VVQSFEAERRDILATAKQMGRNLTVSEQKRLAKLFSERIELHLNASRGQCYLKNPDVASLVARALGHFDGNRYRLFAWCIMPNHVHVVFQAHPGQGLAEIVQTWKSFIAHQANRLLRRKGEFWQREYYDHLIRYPGEFERIVRYVAENPIKAGLKDWPWVQLYVGQD